MHDEEPQEGQEAAGEGGALIQREGVRALCSPDGSGWGQRSSHTASPPLLPHQDRLAEAAQYNFFPLTYVIPSGKQSWGWIPSPE